MPWDASYVGSSWLGSGTVFVYDMSLDRLGNWEILGCWWEKMKVMKDCRHMKHPSDHINSDISSQAFTFRCTKMKHVNVCRFFMHTPMRTALFRLMLWHFMKLAWLVKMYIFEHILFISHLQPCRKVWHLPAADLN